MNFDGEIAVVTGAATGIGEMCAKLFASISNLSVSIQRRIQRHKKIARRHGMSPGLSLVSLLS